jgi:beta-galactosidase
MPKHICVGSCLKAIPMIILSGLLMGSTALSQDAHNISLNGTWSFMIDPYGKGEKSGWSKAEMNPSAWDSMPVPGNWDLKNEYADYVGDAWYTRTFMLDKSLASSRVRVAFQSVYNDAKVYVNGHLAGENHLGFLPFHFDIAQHLKFGEENRLTVLVNNGFKRGALWNWGGIRRPVMLEITPPARLEFQHINAVPNLKTGDATIATKIVCSNTGNATKNLRIGVSIKKDGKVVTEDFMQTKIPANTSGIPWIGRINYPNQKYRSGILIFRIYTNHKLRCMKAIRYYTPFQIALAFANWK